MLLCNHQHISLAQSWSQDRLLSTLDRMILTHFLTYVWQTPVGGNLCCTSGNKRRNKPLTNLLSLLLFLFRSAQNLLLSCVELASPDSTTMITTTTMTITAARKATASLLLRESFGFLVTGCARRKKMKSVANYLFLNLVVYFTYLLPTFF